MTTLGESVARHNGNTSSGLGSLALHRDDHGLYWEFATFEFIAYRASRKGLKMLTNQLETELRAADINGNSAHRVASSHQALTGNPQ